MSLFAYLYVFVHILDLIFTCFFHLCKGRRFYLSFCDLLDASLFYSPVILFTGRHRWFLNIEEFLKYISSRYQNHCRGYHFSAGFFLSSLFYKQLMITIFKMLKRPVWHHFSAFALLVSLHKQFPYGLNISWRSEMAVSVLFHWSFDHSILLHSLCKKFCFHDVKGHFLPCFGYFVLSKESWLWTLLFLISKGHHYLWFFVQPSVQSIGVLESLYTSVKPIQLL